MRSILLPRWKIVVVVLLALAAPLRAKAPPPAKAEASARPPLKKEWVGRWQVAPFADTVAIEILASRSYRVNDPQKIATLMKKLTIRAFHNGMARDFPMIGFTGEKELLVSGYGRILLDKPIIGKLRKALESDAEKAKEIAFLPR